MRAFGGIAECTGGATLATGGTMASGGCLAAVAVPAGWCMIAFQKDVASTRILPDGRIRYARID